MVDPLDRSIGMAGSVGLPSNDGIRIEKTDQVFTGPIEPEVYVDAERIQSRFDRLSLGNGANSVAVREATDRGESLQTLVEGAAQVRDRFTELEARPQDEKLPPEREVPDLLPLPSGRGGEEASLPTVSEPADDAVAQLEEGVDALTSAENAFYDALEVTPEELFTDGVPEVPAPETLPRSEEFYREQTSRVDTFVENVSQQIQQNRTDLLNVGNSVTNAFTPPQQIQAPLEAREFARESSRDIQAFANEALAFQANLEQGTVTDLYLS